MSTLKILVVRLSSIGDIVMCTPAFRCIKKHNPQWQVHFVTKKKYKSVTVANPYIDRFFYLDEDLSAVIEELKKEKYDCIIDLHNNLRSARIKSALKCKAFTIDKLNLEKFVLTRLKINIMPNKLFPTRVLETLKPLGVQDDGLGLDHFIPPGNEISEEDIPASHVAGYIGIVIGATYFTKKLPVHKLIELCAGIKHPVILIGGEEDRRNGDLVAASNPVKVYNACGKFNLNESADLVRRAKLVISNDTGLQYVACAFQKKLIALWGGTSPKIGVAPYYGSAAKAAGREPRHYNAVLNLWCQPCRKYGSNSCPLGHFKCMEHQDIARIVQTAHHMLGI